jgi:hypothetical protein
MIENIFLVVGAISLLVGVILALVNVFAKPLAYPKTQRFWAIALFLFGLYVLIGLYPAAAVTGGAAIIVWIVFLIKEKREEAQAAAQE